MIKKTLTLIITCIFGISSFAGNNVPKVIPALQNWKGQSGKFMPGKTGTIVISKNDSSLLMQTATILADDMKEMFGYEYTVSVTEKAKKGDISLSLNKKKDRLGN